MWAGGEHPHYGVAAVDVDCAFAVGNILFADIPTVQRWDGGQWGHLTQLPQAPKRAGAMFTTGFVNDIDGRSPDDVWAVGHVTYFGMTETISLPLIWRWDGTQWKLSTPYVYSDQWNRLQAVCARADNRTWAVGWARRAPQPNWVTLTERWDGQRWVYVESPNVPGGSSQLFAVASVGGDDAWAVGCSMSAGAMTYEPLAMHWEGVGWKLAGLPRLENSALYGVAAIDPDDAWAVGARLVQPQVNEPLALHWDGAAWHDTAVPALPHDAFFWDVAATGPKDVWAVGMQRTAQWLPQTLIAHWDGKAWTIVNSPNVLVPGGGYLAGSQHFESASAYGGTVWAAGSFVNATSNLEPLFSIQT